MSSPVTGVYFRPGGPATRSCTANYNRLQDGSLVLGIWEESALTVAARIFDRREDFLEHARVSFAPPSAPFPPPLSHAVSEKLKWWFLLREITIIVSDGRLLLSFLSRNT